LVTNSSTFVSSLLADATRRPAQVANLHYFNPAMVMEVVEVVQGPHTSDETAALLVEFAKRVGKRPILMKKEIEGFIANRLLRAQDRPRLLHVRVSALSGSVRGSAGSRPVACRRPSRGDAPACPRERRRRGCALRARG